MDTHVIGLSAGLQPTRVLVAGSAAAGNLDKFRQIGNHILQRRDIPGIQRELTITRSSEATSLRRLGRRPNDDTRTATGWNDEARINCKALTESGAIIFNVRKISRAKPPSSSRELNWAHVQRGGKLILAVSVRKLVVKFIDRAVTSAYGHKRGKGAKENARNVEMSEMTRYRFNPSTIIHAKDKTMST